MGHRRTLLRKQTEDTRITKKNRARGHCISAARGVPDRRVFGTVTGTKAFLLSLEIPPRILKRCIDGVIYELDYHYTKGYRVHRQHAR